MTPTTRSISHLSLYSAAFLLPATFAASFNPCPPLGPVYPAPTSLPSSPVIQSALSNLKDALDTLVTTGNSTNGPYPPANITTWSVGMFSTNDNSSDPFWQYHYTAPTVANSTDGVHEANADSVYRVGSITKLFSVYSLIVAAGDGYWEEPVTNFVPELAAIAKGDPSEGVEDITRLRWEDVTVGDLANHLAGLPRDYSADLSFQFAAAGIPPTAAGFPPLDESQAPACSFAHVCNRTEFFQFYAKRHPIYLPGTTPVYSNEAFQIFGYVVEGITNKTIEQIADESIYKPLGMTQSSFEKTPDANVGVIPIARNGSSWDLSLSDGSPAGSMYSSLRDMTKAGRSMLNSTLIKPAVTRRWLKPGSFTDSLQYSVGKPWEIFRSKINGRVVDAYTKQGNIGYWGTLLVLIPDFQVGFSVLGACGPDPATNPSGGVQPAIIGDVIASTVFPALQKLAKQQAVDKYAGNYTAPASLGINSTATLVADGLPGLNVAKWISNGTSLTTGSIGLISGSPANTISIRAYPSNLRSTAANGTSQVVFNLLAVPETSSGDSGFFTADCDTWLGIDSLEYGGVALVQIVFDLDASGKVTSMGSPALRLQMPKTG